MRVWVAALVGGLVLGGAAYTLSRRRRLVGLSSCKARCSLGSAEHPSRSYEKRRALQQELIAWGMRDTSYSEAQRVQQATVLKKVDRATYGRIVWRMLKRMGDSRFAKDYWFLLYAGYNRVPPTE